MRLVHEIPAHFIITSCIICNLIGNLSIPKLKRVQSIISKNYNPKKTIDFFFLFGDNSI